MQSRVCLQANTAFPLEGPLGTLSHVMLVGVVPTRPYFEDVTASENEETPDETVFKCLWL